jgi:competence protein ComEA
MKRVALIFAALLAYAGMAIAAVNINTATKEQLESLDGVGPVKAQAIVDYRTKNGNFKSLDDVKKVNGIGDATFDKIKKDIALTGTTTAPAKADKSEKVEKKVEAAKEKTKEVAKDTKAAVKEKTADVKAATKEAAQDVKAGAKEVAKDVKAGAKEAVKDTKAAAKEVKDKVKDKAEKVEQKVDDKKAAHAKKEADEKKKKDEEKNK